MQTVDFQNKKKNVQAPHSNAGAGKLKIPTKTLEYRHTVSMEMLCAGVNQVKSQQPISKKCSVQVEMLCAGVNQVKSQQPISKKNRGKLHAYWLMPCIPL